MRPRYALMLSDLNQPLDRVVRFTRTKVAAREEARELNRLSVERHGANGPLFFVLSIHDAGLSHIAERSGKRCSRNLTLLNFLRTLSEKPTTPSTSTTRAESGKRKPSHLLIATDSLRCEDLT